MTRLCSTPAGGIVVVACAAFAGAVAAALALHPPVAGALILVLVSGALIAAVGGSPLRGRRAVILVIVCLAAGALGMLRGSVAAAHAPPAWLAALDKTGPVTFNGTVRDSPSLRGAKSFAVVDVDGLAAADSGSGGGGAVLVPLLGREADLLPGDHVRVEASELRAPGRRPGPESAAALDREGVAAVAVAPRLTHLADGAWGPSRALAVIRQHLRETVAGALAPPGSTLVDEIALGVRDTLPGDVSRPLQDAGLIHFVATSGLKVALVIAMLSRLLAVTALGPRARTTGILAVVALYVALTGGGPAALRAALMAGVGLLLPSTGRRADPLPLLAAVAALLLAVTPSLAGDVGFQLSFLGTLGILVLADPIGRRLPGPRLLIEPVAVTAAAQLFTFPVSASTFGVISLVGPLANGIVMPLVAPLLVSSWLGALAAQISPVLGGLPLQLSGVLAAAMLAVARALAAIPYAALHPGGWPRAWVVAEVAGLAVATAFLALAFRLRRRSPRFLLRDLTDFRGLAGAIPQRRLAAIAGVATCCGVLTAGGLVAWSARPDGRFHVTVLPVGAATAVLIHTSEGGLVLVDGGSDPDRLRRALGEAMPPLRRSIDVLVLTGGERQAVAGLEGLVADVPVASAVIPGSGLGSGAVTLLTAMRSKGTDVVVADAPWSWGGGTWRCLSPGPPDDPRRAGPSCALQVADARGVALILGEMPAAVQEELAARYGRTLHSDLVVAPPGAALAPALLSAAAPRHIAVPSVRQPPATLLRSVRAAVHSTGADGALEYVSGPSGGLERA
jgi:competence protein ComEC